MCQSFLCDGIIEYKSRNYLFDEFRSAEQSDGSNAESNESEKTASRLRFGLLSKYKS